MVKHNNEIPNQHFKKKWQFYVKTWFNQPARKVRRRSGTARPRPCEHLISRIQPLAQPGIAARECRLGMMPSSSSSSTVSSTALQR